jgi:N-acyl-D-aspartate/D-glutamate deacylase
MAQTYEDPELWRQTLKDAERENADGAKLYPQFAARPPGIICGLNAYHTFQRRETFLRLRELPRERMLAELRKAEIKAAILADRDIPDERPGSMENMIPEMLGRLTGRFFSLGDPVDYEPLPNRTVATMAAERRDSEESVLYDCLLEADGRNFMLLPFLNYVHGNHDAIHEMYAHPHTVPGLSDAGAHVKLICDASLSTYSLTHWVRGRSRGERLPLEFVVNKLTARNAELHQLRDRGRIAPGLRADVNVIDLESLSLDLPHMQWDLPAGAGRILQAARGYLATLVAGVQTVSHDEDTGARPGRLLNGAAYAA